MLKKLREITFSDMILLSAILLVGGFHEYISCALAMAMSVWLLRRLLRGKKLVVRKSGVALAVGAACLFYGLSCFWAVDPGMAFIGFLKFLPAGLYLLCLWQEEREGCALQLLPYVGAVTVIVSVAGMYLPVVSRYFFVADRLAGVFQYPNTYALFLLVCQLLVLQKEKRTVWDWLCGFVLIGGLLYTGSRTVFVVAIVANGAMLLALSKKKLRVLLLALGAAACVAAVIFAFHENSVIGRYLRFSLTESTLVGRVLYVVDALPLIWKHPFGLGYMGYYYTQQSVQTGIYSVAYIHNDFLQLFLDVGWLPGILFAGAMITWFFRKDVTPARKIIAGAVCLHSLFDFDLQFVAVLMLLLLLTDTDAKLTEGKKTLPWRVGTAAAAAVCLYMTVTLALGHFGAYRVSDELYPFNTRNKLTMLEQETDLVKANELADEILETNTDYFAPYTIKAQYAYSQGDFGSLIQYKKQVFERNPFDHTQYEEYAQMLINGIALYTQAGDTASAGICRQELLSVPKLLEANADRLSALGKRITDQPVTELSSQLQKQIAQIGGVAP